MNRSGWPLGLVIRRLAAISGLAMAGAGFATPVQAQLGFGAHVAKASGALDGATGVGLRVTAGLPLIPVQFALSGDNFWPDCDDCSYQGASLDVQYHLVPALPLRPFVTGGYAMRRVDPGTGEAETESGIGLGVGVELRLVSVGFYLEGRWERVDPENQWVTRLGLTF
jgi:hypothetical protein